MGGGFCDNSSGSQTGNQFAYRNPLGPTLGNGGSGSNELGSSIFNYLSGSALPNAESGGNNYASALTSAASNPAWSTIQGVAQKNAAGDYLAGSPELNTALAWNQGMAGANSANENARIRSGYAKNGMNFSTGDEQAQQANTTAGNANALNTNAQAYLGNYEAERQNQNNAGNMMMTAQGTPLSYLAAVPGAYTSPLSNVAPIVSGLGSGGQWQQTGTFTNNQDSPSLGSDIMSGVGSL